MLWLFIPLLVILGIIGYLFFAPFYVQINSIDNFYGIRFHRIAYAHLTISANALKLNLWVAGWRKQYDLFSRAPKKKKKPERKRKTSGFSFGRVKAILRSFKINKCYLNIDFGNVQLNGILYPGLYWLSGYINKPIGISFSDKTEVDVELENNLARITKAFIISSIHTKK